MNNEEIKEAIADQIENYFNCMEGNEDERFEGMEKDIIEIVEEIESVPQTECVDIFSEEFTGKRKKKARKDELDIDVLYSKDSGEFKKTLLTHIQSRIPLVHINTKNENRFSTYMHLLSRSGFNLNLYWWDMVDGLLDIKTAEKIDIKTPTPKKYEIEQEKILTYLVDNYQTPLRKDVDNYIKSGKMADVYILTDIQFCLHMPKILRLLKKINNLNYYVCVMIVDEESGAMLKEVCEVPSMTPPALSKEEYKQFLYGTLVRGVKRRIPQIVEETKNNEEAILADIEGKTLLEAGHYLSLRVVKTQSFLPKK
jgi:hypothetical protein